ncbi:MAG: PEP-CTERM sorting domain-containing protein [Planctomycetota bacterium]
MRVPALSLGALLALGIVSSTAEASIVDDLANLTIIEDFQFDDPAATSYDAAANSANPGNLLSTDTTPADLAGVATDGAGALDASLKNNTDFGTTLVDTADLTTGRVFGVMEATWDFQSVLDPSENEELRVTLISSGTAGVLAEWEIQREDDDTLTILGNTVGGDDLPAVLLNGGSLRQVETFVGVVEADLDADTYTVHFSTDGGSTFTTLGTGATDPTRNLDKLRVVLNNDLSGDSVLIDRVYLGVIPEPSSLVGLSIACLALASRGRSRR